jgi:hypothetical protein
MTHVFMIGIMVLTIESFQEADLLQYKREMKKTRRENASWNAKREREPNQK